MLDEMDGKHARRTKNGSALGLLFDHGCDAFTVFSITWLCCKVCGTGNNCLSYMGMATMVTSFHLATLEEYYVGTLVLPACNGVSDGSVALVGMFLCTGIFGNEGWSYGVISGKFLGVAGLDTLTCGQLALFSVIVGQVIVWITHVVTITRTPYPNYDADGTVMDVSERFNKYHFF